MLVSEPLAPPSPGPWSALLFFAPAFLTGVEAACTSSVTVRGEAASLRGATVVRGGGDGGAVDAARAMVDTTQSYGATR